MREEFEEVEIWKGELWKYQCTVGVVSSCCDDGREDGEMRKTHEYVLSGRRFAGGWRGLAIESHRAWEHLEGLGS